MVLDITVDVDARCELLVEIADVHLQQTKNARAAVDALEEAVELRPRDLPLLHRLLDQCLHSRQLGWRRRAVGIADLVNPHRGRADERGHVG